MQREGLYKKERQISSPQAARVEIGHQNGVLNLCANNYLGLADHHRLVNAAKNALDTYGFGMASVRFICRDGTINNKETRRRSLLHP